MNGETDPYEALARSRRRLVTLALLSCAFLAMLDGTVVGTALPRIVEQTGGGAGDGAGYVWLVTVYLLTSSVSVPVYGRFSDLYGRRRLLLGGIGLFLAGSLACGLAGTLPELVLARALQGLGAGSLLTLGMALVRDLYPPERGTRLIRMQTVMASMMVLGLIGGPILGGLLVDHADWRWAFWLNLPLGLVAGTVLMRVLPERRPLSPPGGRFDVSGILLLAGGLSLVLIGLSLRGNGSSGHSAGWTEPAVAGSLLSGLALLALLVPVERRAEVPVLPLRLFRHGPYGGLLAAGFFFQVAALPVGIFLPLYFQHIRGHSATVSGLWLLPLLIGMVLGNRLTAGVILRTGHTRPVLLTGAGLLTVGTAAFFALDGATSPALTGTWLLLAGLGTGPAMGGLMIATQNSVPRADMGTATAGSTLTKQIGGAFGLAWAQTLMGQYTETGAAGPAASAIGSTIAWTGGAAGLLTLVVLFRTRDVPVPVPERRTAASSRPGSQEVER